MPTLCFDHVMIYNRQSIRLKEYDYSQEGVYHITICTQNKKCLFGKVVNGEVKLNDAGKMVEQQWNHLPNRFPNIELDAHIIMPNHVHGIIIVNSIRKRAGTRPTPTIASIVGTFKSISMREYIHGVKHSNWSAFDQKI